MSNDRTESKYADLGYKRNSFLRDESDEEQEPEPRLEPEPKLEPQLHLKPQPKPELKTLEVGVEQMTVKAGTEGENTPVRKAPPMYHHEERSGPPPLHQLRSCSSRGVSNETCMAIRKAIFNRSRNPSSPSNTDDSQISQNPARDFWPHPRTLSRVDVWEANLKIDEENYMSRWNQDTELIRLTRRGDVQGLENYQQKLGSTYRCMIEINTLNACFLSPLAIALYHGNSRAIRLLLAMGARPDVRLSFGNNCFHLVAENDSQGVTLTCLLETCQETFSCEEFDKMLNSPNMFNANPLDILHLRLAQQKPDMHQLQIMVTMMESHGARKRAGIFPDNSWFSPSTI